MSANINDYFNKASSMDGSYPAVATVSSARSAGSSTLSCDDLSSWNTDTPVHFSTFKVAADGTIDTTTQTDWKGIVVGNTITELTRLAGAADAGNASGDRVELNPTIGWLDDLITGLLISHNQNGTLKNSIVKAANIDFSTFDVIRRTGAENAWLNLTTTRQDLLEKITIPTSGKYLVLARAFIEVSSHASSVSIMKNSSILTNASDDLAGQHSLTSFTLEDFAAGDTVCLQGKTDGSGKYYSSRDRLELVCLRVG